MGSSSIMFTTSLFNMLVQLVCITVSKNRTYFLLSPLVQSLISHFFFQCWSLTALLSLKFVQGYLQSYQEKQRRGTELCRILKFQPPEREVH